MKPQQQKHEVHLRGLRLSVSNLRRQVSCPSCRDFSRPQELLTRYLERARKGFKRRLTSGHDQEAIKKLCAEGLHEIKLFLPFVGFILRSTNIRNAFEVYGPLLRLSCDVLEPDTLWKEKSTKLILSSEWTYSPHTYTGIKNLTNFVLIGSPAHEASNPLLIPLAGHELGHSVWMRNKLLSQFQFFFEEEIRKAILADWDRYYKVFFEQDKSTITITKAGSSIEKKAITKEAFKIGDLIVLPTISKASSWIARQAEETFCDCVGIRLFGLSFLKAFAYLLAPNYSSKRSPIYPNLLTRAENQVRTANAYGIIAPDGYFEHYVEMFRDFPEQRTIDADEYQLQLADKGLKNLVGNLIKAADHLLEHENIVLPTEDGTDRIYSRFKQLVPLQPVECLADIINAGWKMYEEIGEANSDGLKELILKNVEIFEIGQILNEQSLLETEKGNARGSSEMVSVPESTLSQTSSLFEL